MWGVPKFAWVNRGLHHGTDLPGHELRPAIAEFLALALPARRDAQQIVEDLLAFLLDADVAARDRPAIDVDVVLHPRIDLAVGSQLDRRRRLAAIGGTAPGGERDHRGARCDLPGGGRRIEAR